jgi:hypothetical protein
MVVWDTKYAGVDLTQLTDFLEMQGIRLADAPSGATARVAARASGAKQARRGGHGDDACRLTPMTREPWPKIARRRSAAAGVGPFNPQLPIGHVPIAGSIAYSLDPDWITIAPGVDGDREDLSSSSRDARPGRQRVARSRST